MTRFLALTLIRHAKSSWRFAGLDDFHRPLNGRGMRDALRMPAHVAANIERPERVYCSAAVRAVQTCQGVCDAYRLEDADTVVDAALYLASAQGILEFLAAEAGALQRVFVVGHNPGLTDLYNYLSAEPVDNLPTLAVAHLHLPVGEWSAVRAHCARVQHLMLPRELS